MELRKFATASHRTWANWPGEFEKIAAKKLWSLSMKQLTTWKVREKIWRKLYESGCLRCSVVAEVDKRTCISRLHTDPSKEVKWQQCLYAIMTVFQCLHIEKINYIFHKIFNFLFLFLLNTSTLKAFTLNMLYKSLTCLLICRRASARIDHTSTNQSINQSIKQVYSTEPEVTSYTYKKLN